MSQDPDKWFDTKFEDVSFLVLNIGFAVEAVMRIMSSGVIIKEDGVKHLVELRPHYYFHDPVNCVDFVVTVLSFIGVRRSAVMLWTPCELSVSFDCFV